jgi:hypothetical protein
MRGGAGLDSLLEAALQRPDQELRREVLPVVTKTRVYQPVTGIYRYSQ